MLAFLLSPARIRRPKLNEASQVVGVQDPNEYCTVSSVLKNSNPIYIYNPRIQGMIIDMA
jgi:hypothetical protein